MQISKEELAETQKLLAGMERAAKRHRSRRLIVAAASLAFLVPGVWGLLTLAGADAYASRQLAAGNEVTPEVLAAGLEWLKHWFVFAVMFVASLVTGGMILMMAVFPGKSRALDPVLAMLLRDYLARAQITPVTPSGGPA